MVISSGTSDSETSDMVPPSGARSSALRWDATAWKQSLYNREISKIGGRKLFQRQHALGLVIKFVAKTFFDAEFSTDAIK